MSDDMLTTTEFLKNHNYIYNTEYDFEFGQKALTVITLYHEKDKSIDEQ